MYFDRHRQINICDFINKKYLIYAHTKEGKNEKLENHIELCVKYFFNIVNEKHLNQVFEKLEMEFLKNYSLEGREIFNKKSEWYF